MKVYAIVVTYNALPWINRCIKSLMESLVPTEIIIIDNSSVDGTIEYIRNTFPEIELITNDDNLGFGKANNIGLKTAYEANADYVFLLNQDAWIEPDTILNLINIQKRTFEFGILSPMHMNAEYSKLDYGFSLYITPQFCPDICSDIYTGNCKDAYETEFVNAAAWLITKQCLDRIGFFDPLFFHYGEDKNYCQRVQYHGLKIGICPSVRAVHDRGGRQGLPDGHRGKPERQRLMLLDFCDVRKPETKKAIQKYKIKLFGLILWNSLILNFVGVRENLSDYLYLDRSEKAILESVTKNRLNEKGRV